MIRAGREHLVRTVAELAADWGLSLPMFRKRKIHQASGFPAPVSSPKAKPQLWDGGQTDAYRAGREVPQLPAEDPDDLLDRHEVAALLDVDVRSWDKYATETYAPGNAGGLPEVPEAETLCDVPLWRRSRVEAWNRERSGGGAGGRPTGSADLVPREEIRPRTAALLRTDPRITAEALATAVRIHPETAREALADVRTELIAAALADGGEERVASLPERTGMPDWALQRLHPAARLRVDDQERRAAEHYGAAVAQHLSADGAELLQACAADSIQLVIVPLPDPVPGRPTALLWDARWGWATTAQPNPGPTASAWLEGEAAAPHSDAVRYRGAEVVATASEIEASLRGRGRSRPPRTAATPEQRRDVARRLALYLPKAERIGSYLPGG